MVERVVRPKVRFIRTRTERVQCVSRCLIFLDVKIEWTRSVACLCIQLNQHWTEQKPCKLIEWTCFYHAHLSAMSIDSNRWTSFEKREKSNILHRSTSFSVVDHSNTPLWTGQTRWCLSCQDTIAHGADGFTVKSMILSLFLFRSVHSSIDEVDELHSQSTDLWLIYFLFDSGDRVLSHSLVANVNLFTWSIDEQRRTAHTYFIGARTINDFADQLHQ